MTALRRAAVEGSLILCEIALAEVAPTLPPADMPQFLSDWNLTFVASSQASAILAGEMFRTYLQRGGKGGRVVPDFLLAAHAQIHANVCWPGIGAITGITSNTYNCGIPVPTPEAESLTRKEDLKRKIFISGPSVYSARKN